MSTQAVFSQVLAKTLPDALQYDLPKESVHAERQTTRFEPAGGYAQYKPRSTCTINLPSIDAFMDTACTYLTVEVTVPQNSKFKLPQCGAHGLIQTLRLYHSSGALLDEIQSYNLLAATQMSLSVEDSLRDGVLNLMQGMGQATLSTTPSKFMFPLRNIIFANSKHIALKYLGGIRLEIVWAPAEECLVQVDTEAVLRDYTLTNVSLVTSLVKPSDLQIQSYDQMFRERGLSLYGVGFKHHYLPWSTRNATLTISDRSASIKDITCVMRDLTTTSQSTDAARVVDKLHARANKVAKHQWSVAGKLMPSRPVEGPIEALAEAMDATHGNLGGYAVNFASWTHGTNGSYVIMREMETSRQLVSGDSTSRDKQVDIQLILQGTVDSPNCQVDCFVSHDKVLRFEPTGSVAIFE